MDAPDSFWGAGAPQALHIPAPSGVHPTFSQRSQRSLPGPAGRLAAVAQPAASGVTSGGGAGLALTSLTGAAGLDPDFQSQQWRTALDDMPFDEDREPFRGNTVRVAAGLQQNGVVNRLLAVVVSIKRCHSGEAFVRLKDPTGTIGGTLTRAVLDSEPDVRQGAVLLLRRVTVLRTPPPRRINHLCITLDSVVQVIPAMDSTQTAAAAAAPQAPPRAFPALPAPPTGGAASAPATTWLPQPSLQQTQQPNHAQQQQQQQQQGRPVQPPPVPQARGRPGMPPPPPRQMAAPSAPSSSFAWPSLAPVRQQQQQPDTLCRQPTSQQPQQHQPRGQQSNSFAWPSLQLGGAQRAEAQQAPAQQQPAMSESVNFSMPAISEPSGPWQRAACQDDASSGPAAQGGPSLACSPNNRAQLPTAGGAQAGSGAGWLQGLLAEAEYPFGSMGGSQAGQASQQPAAIPRRPPLAERRQQQHVVVPPLQLAHCSPPMQAAKRARHEQQQQQASPPLVAGGGASAVFAGADALDLGEEW